LWVVILDKPRELGAQVSTPSDGDVAGALAVLLEDGDADLLIGVDGTPEGVMTACAARALGGELQGRMVPKPSASDSPLRTLI
jgi:fructose-1,6-bisphosphatase II